MLTIDSLKEFGADTESGLARCMGNEEFYLKMVEMLLSENSLGALEEALNAGNLDAAFEAAHSLKGVAGNLSLTPLAEPAIAITEHLRARKEMDYAPLLSEIKAQFDALSNLAG